MRVAKIDRDIWFNRKFRALSQTAQMQFLKLMCGEPFDCTECSDGFDFALAELSDAGVIELTSATTFFWLDKLGCHPVPKSTMTGLARKWISNAVRAIIFEKYGKICVYCGATERIQLDHIVPVARGGTDALDNLVPSCKPCNCSKGAKTLEEWFA